MMEDLRAEVDKREVGRREGQRSSIKGKADKKGLGQQRSAGQAAAAACMTLSQPSNIWDSIEPLFNITIKL
jgi:hypothetical protein